jgi:hypothetical protein
MFNSSLGDDGATPSFFTFPWVLPDFPNIESLLPSTVYILKFNARNLI